MDALTHEKKNQRNLNSTVHVSVFGYFGEPSSSKTSGGMPRHFGTCATTSFPAPQNMVLFGNALCSPFFVFIYFLKSISELDVRKCKSRLPNLHNSSPVSFFNWVVRAGLYGRCQEVANDFSWNGAGKLDGPPFRLDWDGPWHGVLHMWHAHAQQHPEDNTFTLRRINSRSQVWRYVAATTVSQISGVSLAPQRGIKLYFAM